MIQKPSKKNLALSINLNAQHENGMTHFDLTLHSGKLQRLIIKYSEKSWFVNTLFFGLS